MATYVNNLRLKEITTGDESGTWGTSTNTNLELIADAFGSGTEVITTNADTHTTTIADGAADEGRAIFLKYTGTLDSACTITIAPNTVNKLWLIENATSGSQNIIISQGSGANITIGNGKIAAVFTDGAGAGAAVLDAFADLELSSTLTVAGAASLASTLAVTGASTLTGALTANGGAIFNEGSADVDFRIESNGNANMFFVDGGNDKIGIGTATPAGVLEVYTSSASVAPDSDADEFVIESSGSAGISILTGASNSGMILFGDSGDNGRGKVYYDHNADSMKIAAGGTVGITMDSSQDVTIAGDLVVSGVGPHAIGTSTNAGMKLNLGGAFTGGSTTPHSLRVDGRLTSPSSTSVVYQSYFANALTTDASSHTVTTIAQVAINECDITLGSGSSATNSASLYIASAATEATNNYALWVDAGNVLFDAELEVVGQAKIGGGTTISTSGEVKVESGGKYTVADGNDLNIVYPSGRSLFFKEGSTKAFTIDNSNHVGVEASKRIYLDGSGGTFGNTYLTEASADQINLVTGGSTAMAWTSGQDTVVPATSKIYLDGGSDTYIVESSSNTMDLYTSNLAVRIDGNQNMTIHGPSLTIGDSSAEDTKIVFDGNAQDFYMGLDDTDDDFKIGVGSTVGSG